MTLERACVPGARHVWYRSRQSLCGWRRTGSCGYLTDLRVYSMQMYMLRPGLRVLGCGQCRGRCLSNAARRGPRSARMGSLMKCFRNLDTLDHQGTHSLTRPKEFHSKQSLPYSLAFNGLNYYVFVCLQPQSLYSRVRIKTSAPVNSVRVPDSRG